MDQVEALKKEIEQLKKESEMQTEYLFHGELGNFSFAQRNLELAEKLYNRTLQIAKAMHNRSGEAATLGNLGMVYTEQSDTERAITLYEEALKIARELGERQLEGNILNNSGLAYGKRGDREKAKECYHDAFAIARELNDQGLLESVLNNLQLLPSEKTNKQQIDTSEQECLTQDSINTSDAERSTGVLTLRFSRKWLYLITSCISLLTLAGIIILVCYMRGTLSLPWSPALSGLFSGESLLLSLALWFFIWQFPGESLCRQDINRARYSAHSHNTHPEIDR